MRLYFGRAKHSGRQFISDHQRFTAGMLRPYEYICKNEMHLMQVLIKLLGFAFLTTNLVTFTVVKNQVYTQNLLGNQKYLQKMGFSAGGLSKSHRRGESVVIYNTGRVNTVARKNAVNSPGDQKGWPVQKLDKCHDRL